MCGIFAYLNFNVKKERRYILQVLFNGLRRLEYRGYDSAGIAIDSDHNSSSSSDKSVVSSPPLVFRREGNIESLVKSVYHGTFPLLDLSLIFFEWIGFSLFVCFRCPENMCVQVISLPSNDFFSSIIDVPSSCWKIRLYL
jgi:hypothetical protein